MNQEPGGYSYELVSKEDEEKSMCQICYRILREPTLTGCCGQHYCNSCLEIWLTTANDRKCPYGCEKTFQSMKDLKFKREVINCLLVKCPNKKCQWQGRLSDVPQHLTTCDEVEIECNLGCGKKITREKLLTHTQHECFYRMFKCKFCQHQATYFQITGKKETITYTAQIGSEQESLPAEMGHYATCLEFPKSCPNMCGHTLKRRELKNHCEQCVREKVQCTNMKLTPVKMSKCGEVVERHWMKNHRKFECLYRNYTCDLCGHTGTYTEITGEDTMTPYKPTSNVEKEYPPPEKGHYMVCQQYPKECPNNCGEKMKRNEIEEHRMLCLKEKVRCKNWKVKGIKWGGASDKCGEVMERHWLRNHVAHECLYRNYECRFCHYEDKYTVITGMKVMKRYNPSEQEEAVLSPKEFSHYSTCNKYPVGCPNKCEVSLPREEVAMHRESCPLEPVSCLFRDTGCGVTIPRKDLDDHIKEKQSEHLNGLLSAHSRMQKDFNTHTSTILKELEVTKKELEFTRKDLDSTKRYLAEAVCRLNSASQQLEIRNVVGRTPRLAEECQEQSEHLSVCLHVSKMTMQIHNFTLHGTTGVPWRSPDFHIHLPQAKDIVSFNIVIHPQFSRKGTAHEYEYRTTLVAVESEGQAIPIEEVAQASENSDKQLEIVLSYQKTIINLAVLLDKDHPQRASMYHELANILYGNIPDDCLELHIETSPRSRRLLSRSGSDKLS